MEPIDRAAPLALVLAVSLLAAACGLTGCGFYDVYTPSAVAGRAFRTIPVTDSDGGLGPEGFRAADWRISSIEGGALIFGVQRARVTIARDDGQRLDARCTHDLRTAPTHLVCLLRRDDGRTLALVLLGEAGQPMRGRLVGDDVLIEVDGQRPDRARYREKHSPLYVLGASGAPIGGVHAGWPTTLWIRETAPATTRTLTEMIALTLLSVGDVRDHDPPACSDRGDASPGLSASLCLDLSATTPLAVSGGARIADGRAPYVRLVDRLRASGAVEATALMAHLTATEG